MFSSHDPKKNLCNSERRNQPSINNEKGTINNGECKHHIEEDEATKYIQDNMNEI
jgi:hypothetical protein